MWYLKKGKPPNWKPQWYNYSCTWLGRPQFVQHLCYSIMHSVISTNSPKGTYFSSPLLRTIYITASTSDMTMPIICSNIIFQAVDYYENSNITSSWGQGKLAGQCLGRVVISAFEQNRCRMRWILTNPNKVTLTRQSLRGLNMTEMITNQWAVLSSW